MAIERDGDASASMGVRLASGLFQLKRRIPAILRSAPCPRHGALPIRGYSASAQILKSSCRKEGKVAIFASGVFFGSRLSATRWISDSADFFPARFWRTTWQHSPDHKAYSFPPHLRHSPPLHWRRCCPATSLPPPLPPPPRPPYPR